jgi:tetratricopeptide (TPR) repeat protein
VLLVAVAACATSLDKARTARRAGDFTVAESRYREAAEDPKQKGTALGELATMHAERAEKTQDTAQAEALFRRALELDPTHDRALTGLIRAMRRTGRLDEAEALLKSTRAAQPCEACNRLEVVVLLELGERELKAEKWEAALARFQAAQAMRPQSSAAVAIANAYARAGKYGEAADALEAARAAMKDADASLRSSYFDVRVYVVAAALDKNDLALADRTRSLSLPAEPPAKQLAGGLLVADHVFAKGDTKAAAERYVALLEIPDLDEASKEKLVDKAVKIHANEATAQLHAGNGEAADAALARAIELRPDDWVLKLQRVLALSGRSGAGKGLDSLAAVPTGTVGLPSTRAILLSLRVEEQLRAGDLTGAKASLAAAQKAEPDLPEVHLATARVLARTAVLDLDKREVKALRGKGALVRYSGDVLLYGEALSDIDFVKAELQKRRKTTLFTAPWIAKATDDLENQLFGAYPHTVKFREQAEPLVVLFNGGDRTIDVTITGPDEYRDRAVIAPDDLHELQPPRAGVLHLKVGRSKRVFFAEPFIEVTLKL